MYSLIKFFEKVEEGDSLTDLERKTGLSNVTIQKVVKDLESSALLTTRWRRTSRGRIKECINVSKPAKMLATQLVQIIREAKCFFEKALEENTIDQTSPFIFQMIMLHEALKNIGEFLDKEVSNEFGDLFREWVRSAESSNSEKSVDFVEGFSTHKISSIEKNEIYFDPEMFTIYIDFSSAGKLVINDSNIWTSSKKTTSEGKVATD
jgi:hypothetical protein